MKEAFAVVKARDSDDVAMVRDGWIQVKLWR